MTMAYLLQSDRIPVEAYEHDKSSIDFLKIVKEKLEKRKHLWAFAITVYMVSLMLGMHLLLFGLESLAGKWGWVGVFYGISLGLTGKSAGDMYARHQSKYGDMLKRIERILAE